MNLTGARTSHQMGKEIGYERWPAIKSDIPQCHLSDSGRGIMTTANESWALVRRWFKSAPRCADSVPCTPSNPAGCHRTKERETLDILPNCFKLEQMRDQEVYDITQVQEEQSALESDLPAGQRFSTRGSGGDEGLFCSAEVSCHGSVN